MKRGILATRDELKALREKISRKPFDAIYANLQSRCNLILSSAPITESQWRLLWQQGNWGAALQAARTAQGRMLDLLIAHHIDRNLAYRDRAIEELTCLCQWSTWLDPAHGNSHLAADLCTAEAAVAATVALDWLWEDLDDAQRAKARQAILDKGLRPYLQGVHDNAWWYECYHNWNTVLNGGCGLVAAALADEEPEASEALELAEAGLKHFLQALGREGGWDEGTGYWGYAMRYLLLYAHAQERLADDMRVFHARGMDNTGAFPVYFTPNGQAASFGDAPSVPLHGALYLLTRHYNLPDLTWWLDTYSFHRDVSNSGWSAAGLALLFRPDDLPTPDDPGLEPLKVFGEIGWAALADRWPKPTFYVAAKTGDLAANHAQRDMNSLQVQLDGEMLLTDLGPGRYSSEYFSERRGEFYEVQARAHNTIVIAERDHALDAQGSIVASAVGENYRWIACDSGEALGEGVLFVRHVVLVVDPADQAGRMLVVLDEVDSGSPEQLDLFWHTRGQVRLDESTGTGLVRGQKSELHFAIRASLPGILRTFAHNSDHGVQFSGGIMDRSWLLSVFSRDVLEHAPHAKPTEDGGLKVTAGPATLHFATSRKCLELKAVVVE